MKQNELIRLLIVCAAFLATLGLLVFEAFMLVRINANGYVAVSLWLGTLMACSALLNELIQWSASS